MKWNLVHVAFVALTLLTGCTNAQLKSDEAAIKSDAHAGFLLLGGIAHAAMAHPELLAEAAPIAGAVLQKAGVPPATSAKVTAAINAKDAAALAAASDEGAAFTSSSPPVGP